MTLATRMSQSLTSRWRGGEDDLFVAATFTKWQEESQWLQGLGMVLPDAEEDDGYYDDEGDFDSKYEHGSSPDLHPTRPVRAAASKRRNLGPKTTTGAKRKRTEVDSGTEDVTERVKLVRIGDTSVAPAPEVEMETS